MINQTRDNLPLYYEERGLKQGQCIVFLNGLTQTTLAWELVVRELEKDFRIILLDQIFQGRSGEAENYRNFDGHAQDVFDLLASLQINKPVIAGLSYGSLIAQHYALNYPQNLSSLILMSTFAETTPLFQNIGLSWKNSLQKGGYELMLDVMLPYVLGKNYFDNPFIPIDTLKNLRKELHPKTSNLVKLMQATEERPDFLEKLKNISCPTAIIHGRFDMLLPLGMAENVHKSVKSSSLFVIENCGHTINLEAPVKLCEIVRTFLSHC